MTSPCKVREAERQVKVERRDHQAGLDLVVDPHIELGVILQGHLEIDGLRVEVGGDPAPSS